MIKYHHNVYIYKEQIKYMEILNRVGLTENEKKVYLSLLSIRTGTVGKLTKITNIHRKNIYDALERLIEKGLATYVIENKIKYFQAKSPENLTRYLDEKKSKIDEEKKELAKIMSKLTNKFNQSYPEIESEIYRGTEGIKTILKECLNYKEVLMIGATGDVESRLPYFWPQYNKKREKLKCKWKLLLVNEAKNKKITKSQYYEYKVLPKILSGLNVIYIYGEYTANILWLEKPVAFVTKHKNLAENYRKYFKFLWKTVE